MLQEFWYAVTHATIELPALELVILIGLLALCLILRCTRIGLISAYAFTYRWGWQFMSSQKSDIIITYVILGIIVGALAVISMLGHAGRD